MPTCSDETDRHRWGLAPPNLGATGLQRSLENLVCYEDGYQYRDQVALLVIAGDTAIAVECKSSLSVEDVDEHLDRLALFKDCWAEYAGYRLPGAQPLAQPPRPLARPDPPLARLLPPPVVALAVGAHPPAMG